MPCIHYSLSTEWLHITPSLNGCTSHLLRHCQAVCFSNAISVAVPLGRYCFNQPWSWFLGGKQSFSHYILAGLGGEPQSRICSKTASEFSKCFFFRPIVHLNHDLVFVICITAPSELDLPLFIAACNPRIAVSAFGYRIFTTTETARDLAAKQPFINCH